MSRQKLIAGNWKMYKTIGETVDFVKELALSDPFIDGAYRTFTSKQLSSDPE